MARYQREFEGIPGDIQGSGGMDPNFRGGRYRGMRMRGEPSQAEYGWYRARHADELGGEGRPAPRSQGHRMYSGEYESGYGNARGAGMGYDRGYRGGGGVRDVRYDREFMRDFNANSPLFREEGRRQGRYGQEYRERGGHPIDRDTEFQPRYSNRGLSSSGYSESWAGWPMRGGR